MFYLGFLEAFRCSESAIAMACLGLVTLGPFLDPLWRSPFLNSSITTLTLLCFAGLFFIFLDFFLLILSFFLIIIFLIGFHWRVDISDCFSRLLSFPFSSALL